jgi:hypothetical protein
VEKPRYPLAFGHARICDSLAFRCFHASHTAVVRAHLPTGLLFFGTLPATTTEPPYPSFHCSLQQPPNLHLHLHLHHSTGLLKTDPYLPTGLLFTSYLSTISSPQSKDGRRYSPRASISCTLQHSDTSTLAGTHNPQDTNAP